MRIKAGTQEIFIKDSTAIRFEAAGQLTRLFLENGRSMILDDNIESIEAQLSNSSFIRVHADHLVNAEHIRSIPEESSEGIVLSDEVNVPVENKSFVRLKEIIENHINPRPLGPQATTQ